MDQARDLLAVLAEQQPRRPFGAGEGGGGVGGNRSAWHHAHMWRVRCCARAPHKPSLRLRSATQPRHHAKQPLVLDMRGLAGWRGATHVCRPASRHQRRASAPPGQEMGEERALKLRRRLRFHHVRGRCCAGQVLSGVLAAGHETGGGAGVDDSVFRTLLDRAGGICMTSGAKTHSGFGTRASLSGPTLSPRPGARDAFTSNWFCPVDLRSLARGRSEKKCFSPLDHALLASSVRQKRAWRADKLPSRAAAPSSAPPACPEPQIGRAHV